MAWIKDSSSLLNESTLTKIGESNNVLMFNGIPVASGGAVDPNSHTHNNKSTLDLLGQSGNTLLFNGVAVAGGGSATNPAAYYLKDKYINCLGDSLTNGSTFGTPWTTLLSQQYGCIVNNYGINGTTLTDDGGTGSMFYRYPYMDIPADVVIVWGGWNDIAQGKTLGAFNDVVTTTFYGSLQSMCSGLQTRYAPNKIFFCTILDSEHSWAIVQNFNNAIREVTEYWGIQVIEMSRLGFNARNAKVKTDLIPDGVHPNTAGNQVITDYIARFISSH